MPTSYQNSENPGDDLGDIIQSIGRIIDLQSQTHYLYDMEIISLSKEKCTYVEIYCVKPCEKMVDPYWLGYKFQPNFYSIEKRYSKFCYMCHNWKGKRKHIFSKCHNDST